MSQLSWHGKMLRSERQEDHLQVLATGNLSGKLLVMFVTLFLDVGSVEPFSAPKLGHARCQEHHDGGCRSCFGIHLVFRSSSRNCDQHVVVPAISATFFDLCVRAYATGASNAPSPTALRT